MFSTFLGKSFYGICFWGIGGSLTTAAYFFCKWMILTAEELLTPMLVSTKDVGDDI